MIKVRECGVNEVHDEVDIRDKEFKSRDDLWNYIEEEHGLINVHGDNIKEKQENDVTIKLEHDISFIQWEIL